jgi:hypothetical protein
MTTAIAAIEHARAVPIEHEITRRGLKLRRAGGAQIGAAA